MVFLKLGASRLKEAAVRCIAAKFISVIIPATLIFKMERTINEESCNSSPFQALVFLFIAPALP